MKQTRLSSARPVAPPRALRCRRSRALSLSLLLSLSPALTACPGTRDTIYFDLGQQLPEAGIGFPDASVLEGGPPGDLGPLDNSVIPPDKLIPPDTGPPPCPNACVDNDPCTSDSCVAGACVNAKIGAEVVRYYNASTGAHAFGPAGSGPAGFTAEAPVFRTLSLAVAGSVTIYQQAAASDYMLSTSAAEGVACCGYANAGDVGQGFASQQQGTLPLYRLFHAASGLHLSSTSATEGTQSGYVLEGVTVHVCPL